MWGCEFLPNSNIFYSTTYSVIDSSRICRMWCRCRQLARLLNRKSRVFNKFLLYLIIRISRCKTVHHGLFFLVTRSGQYTYCPQQSYVMLSWMCSLCYLNNIVYVHCVYISDGDDKHRRLCELFHKQHSWGAVTQKKNDRL